MTSRGQQFKYSYLCYQPSPELGEYGSRMIVALVAFPISEGRARLWLQKGRVARIADFGCAEDKDFIVEFLDSFRSNLEVCDCPGPVLSRIQDILAVAADVLGFTEYKTLTVDSLDLIPSTLGFEVEEFELLSREYPHENGR